MSALDDWNMIVFLTGGVGPCSLDRSPKSNWVQKNGGLPNYICHIARAITGNGHSINEAIPMAIGTAKRWAAGGSTNGTATAKRVHPATQAKAAAAVAQWEALRARAHAGHVVKATHPLGGQYLMLTDIGSFNTEMVRQAWSAMQRDLQLGHRPYDPDNDGDDDSPELASGYIIELGSDYIIVEYYDKDGVGASFARYPYTVEGNTVSFDNPQQVKQAYVPVSDDDPNQPDEDGDDDSQEPDDEDEELTPEEEQAAKDENPFVGYTPLEKITRAAGY
jgi:uncharacterized protein YdaT